MGMDWTLREGYSWPEDQVKSIDVYSNLIFPYRNTVKKTVECYRQIIQKYRIRQRREDYLRYSSNMIDFTINIVIVGYSWRWKSLR